MQNREQMNIVIIGHVDHGKSTVIGRLLAETHSLPEGKLESVKAFCRSNSRVFEYAFLLDALKEEQAQGITIDSARSFFKTKKRDYIIIDAPGHVEFIRNMITGAARAGAALIVIDAKEGIQENSRRHGYLASMLGIKQVCVVVNKMDLVDYSGKVFESVKKEYEEFLNKIGVKPCSFIPLSARNGENMLSVSDNMKWYRGLPLIEQIDAFQMEDDNSSRPFRFPVQDVYKFTNLNDDRRILAGMVQSGTIHAGDEVKFYPSCKKSKIKTIELLSSASAQQVAAGYSTGFTLEDPIYIKAGEIMIKPDEDRSPLSGRRFRVNFFWMGVAPLPLNKNVKLKIGTAGVVARLVEIRGVIDASDLTGEENKKQLDRYDVADCVFETSKPVAFDLAADFDSTGRFVLIDQYQISGCGIILEKLDESSTYLDQIVRSREIAWDKGLVTLQEKQARNNHRAKFILFSGEAGAGKRALAKELEKQLFMRNHQVYYLGFESLAEGLGHDLENRLEDKEEQVRRIGELARIMTDAGLIFITALDGLDDYDLEKLKLLNAPAEVLVIQVGEDRFEKYPVDLKITSNGFIEDDVLNILQLLRVKEILPEYYL